ncbi:putative metal-dependent enzyme (double-stranded beta helix superfamily) [Erwinia toletana]|uniref:Metal-dependent enzyme (Double-stranded beta helix superfamily) n=1 Tax=Winslowiella toletana TaxID=92490 RepID=A0ABS4P6H3_9GAMM|nr:cysteine dioxygenase [Winslowiella toletana]MBP2167767.1 putative metal-dependent enzyme (double-stranded beta helix superfamily) [Winslowiella toletana]
MSILQSHRLRDFVGGLAQLLDETSDESLILPRGAQLLQKLIQYDDWLDEAFTLPDPARYQQYLLHADARQRFSVVSFVWGAGQSTPVHDHRVWGLIGMLRGAEISQSYQRDASGLQPAGAPVRLEPGNVESVSPNTQDIHRVSNAFNDRTSVSIHVYGANIGAVQRAVYREDGSEKAFISGYSNRYLPNIWDLSHD